MSRVLVTVQRRDRAEEAARELAGCGGHVTVVGIVERLPWCAHWVGVTGVAQCSALRQELVDEAVRAVRATVAGLPASVGVEHRVAWRWCEPRLLERLARGDWDEVVLIAEPGRRDRRAFERAARAGGARLTRIEPRAEVAHTATPAFA